MVLFVHFTFLSLTNKIPPCPFFPLLTKNRFPTWLLGSNPIIKQCAAIAMRKDTLLWLAESRVSRVCDWLQFERFRFLNTPLLLQPNLEHGVGWESKSCLKYEFTIKKCRLIPSFKLQRDAKALFYDMDIPELTGMLKLNGIFVRLSRAAASFNPRAGFSRCLYATLIIKLEISVHIHSI